MKRKHRIQHKKPEENLDFEIVVTKIAKRWHARLFLRGEVLDEMACANRLDIGWICRQMLRWQDKGGTGNAFSHAARMRIVRGPYGQIWYQNELKRKARQ